MSTFMFPPSVEGFVRGDQHGGGHELLLAISGQTAGCQGKVVRIWPTLLGDRAYGGPAPAPEKSPPGRAPVLPRAATLLEGQRNMDGTAVLTESFVLEWLSATLAAAEAEEVCLLHALNSECVRALARSDTSWCRAYLSDDFVCTLADGRRRDKAWFLRRTTKRRTSQNVTCDEVDVKAFGKLGLVHGVAHSGEASSLTSTRFTHVWLVRDGRWQLVAAHLTRVAAKPSLQIV